MDVLLDVIMLPVGFSVLSVVCWFMAIRTDPQIRLPLGLYSGFYLATTVIGGVLIGCSRGEVLDTLQWGLDLTVICDCSSIRYWGLLFAPLIVPAMCIVVLHRFRLVEDVFVAPLRLFDERLSPLALCCVYAIFAGYCVVQLSMHGLLFNVLLWFSLQGDYLTMILRRQEAFESLGSAFFGIAYITLPTLSFCALYQYRQLRTLSWQLRFFATAASTLLINMELMQKSPSLLFLTFTGIGSIELKTLKLRSLVYMLAGLVCGVTLLQALFIDQWAWWNSIQLLIFRMASSFPFYVNIYPNVLPYSGIESGLHLVGLGEPAIDCFDVFNCMYPSVTWIQGAAPGPAHMRAYSQAGLPYALGTLVLIGFVIKGIGALRVRNAGPISFAIYLQSLAFLYYLTQTSLRESIISCYGIFWAIVGLIPIALTQTSQAKSATINRINGRGTFRRASHRTHSRGATVLD